MNGAYIPYGRQTIDDADVDAVADVLRGSWLTSGPTVTAFEEAVAGYVGADYAVAFSSGTAALHAAVATAGIGPGDLLVTSPLTFMASANCGRYVGANIALTDIDRDSFNIDLQAIPPNADAVVAVHYAGLPIDLASASWTPPVVIEDAAHALGAETPAGKVGNCASSDMCMFSFHPVKPVTTAEGGVITTNSAEQAARLRRFGSHGIERDPSRGGWFYEIDELGFNYRLSDVQAALGLSQMAKLDSFIDRRNELANRYRELLSDAEVVLPPAAPDGSRHGYHLFAIQVAERRRVYDHLHAAGIGVQVHYVPVHHHPISDSIQLPVGGLPVCDQVYSGLLSLPIFPTLTDAQQDRVVETLKAAVG
jgi:perosamine synthetase